MYEIKVLVSIPQAVFACATRDIRAGIRDNEGFNTASGIRLCNIVENEEMGATEVSIPQAVFACATSSEDPTAFWPHVSIPQAVFACATRKRRKRCWGGFSFNTASGIRLCNKFNAAFHLCDRRFNTASGIRLCNSIPAEAARVLA